MRHRERMKLLALTGVPPASFRKQTGGRPGVGALRPCTLCERFSWQSNVELTDAGCGI